MIDFKNVFLHLEMLLTFITMQGWKVKTRNGNDSFSPCPPIRYTASPVPLLPHPSTEEHMFSVELQYHSIIRQVPAVEIIVSFVFVFTTTGTIGPQRHLKPNEKKNPSNTTGGSFLQPIQVTRVGTPGKCSSSYFMQEIFNLPRANSTIPTRRIHLESLCDMSTCMQLGVVCWLRMLQE